MSVKDTKDLNIETENIVFGRVTFFHMKIPVEWNAYPIPRRTDAELWIEVDDTRWVTDGYTGFVLVDEGKGVKQPVYVKVKRNIDRRSIEEIFSRELSGRKVLEHRNIDEYEEAFYYIYRRRRRKYIFFGPVEDETILKMIINCRRTYRVLILEFPITEIEDFRRNILPYFLDIRC